MTERVALLVRQFEAIYREHMKGLPIVNTRLNVEAVGFREFDGHQLGVLITPWFMNLVLIAASDEWSNASQGDTSSIDFPCGPIEFTKCVDELFGTYLTAVLFRSVSDLHDQSLAREIARQIMQDLFNAPRKERPLSRRELLTGRCAS